MTTMDWSEIEIVFTLLAIYGATALIILATRRFRVKQQILLHQANPNKLGTLDHQKRSARGVTGSQIASLVLHIILFAGMLLVAPLYILNFLEQNQLIPYGPSGHYTALTSGFIILYGFIMLALTPLTIIINAFWIYPAENIHAEELALYTKQATKLLKFERILAWIVWIPHTFFAAWIGIAEMTFKLFFLTKLI